MGLELILFAQKRKLTAEQYIKYISLQSKDVLRLRSKVILY